MTKKALSEHLEIAGKITALLTFSAGVIFYIGERTLPVRLSVAQPYVVEFRCQVATIDFGECFEDRVAEFRNLSLSAALRLTANGPSAQGISVEEVFAKVKLPWDEQGKLVVHDTNSQVLTLTAFWSGDLTGGGADFQQVVAETIPGGMSVRREYWMMPMPEEECAASEGGTSDNCRIERANFKPWIEFVERAYEAARKAPAGKPYRIEVEITIKGNPSGWWREQELTLNCNVVLGRSALVALRDPLSNRKGEPGWLTLPCRT